MLPAFIFYSCAGNQDKKENTEKSTKVSQADMDLLTKA